MRVQRPIPTPLPCTDPPTCEPLHPGDRGFSVWLLVTRHYNGQRTTFANPCCSYRSLDTAVIAAVEEAKHGGGFFTTVLLTDSLGRVIGKVSATTMAKKAPDDRSAAPRSLPWPAVWSTICAPGNVMADWFGETGDTHEEAPAVPRWRILELDEAERVSAD